MRLIFYFGSYEYWNLWEFTTNAIAELKSHQQISAWNRKSREIVFFFSFFTGDNRLAAITGSKYIESYPLVASSQHVGAAVTILLSQFMLLEQYTINPEIHWLKFQPIRIQ